MVATAPNWLVTALTNPLLPFAPSPPKDTIPEASLSLAGPGSTLLKYAKALVTCVEHAPSIGIVGGPAQALLVANRKTDVPASKKCRMFILILPIYHRPATKKLAAKNPATQPSTKSLNLPLRIDADQFNRSKK